VKWTAQRNRVAALAAQLPGPHAVIKIAGGLPPDVRAKTEPSAAPVEPGADEAEGAQARKASGGFSRPHPANKS
jgi:hypothetical protein